MAQHYVSRKSSVTLNRGEVFRSYWLAGLFSKTSTGSKMCQDVFRRRPKPDDASCGPNQPELRSSDRERTRPACRFGRRARTFVPPACSILPRTDKVSGTKFSARRRKPHARGVPSPFAEHWRRFNSVFEISVFDRVRAQPNLTGSSGHALFPLFAARFLRFYRGTSNVQHRKFTDQIH